MAQELHTPSNQGGHPSATKPSGLNITSKIALAFIGMGSLAALVTALASYFLYSSVLQNEATAKLGAARVLLQSRVDSEFERLMADNSALATTPALRSFLSSPVGADAAAPDSQIKSALVSLMARGGFQNVLLFDNKSNLLLSAKDIPTGSDAAALAAQLTKQGGKSTLRAITAKTINDSVILYAAPVLSAESAPLGYVVTLTSAESIFKMLALSGNSQFGSTGEAYLVNRDLAPGSPLRQGVSTQRIDSTGVKNALQGTEGSDSYKNYAGVDVLGSYGRLKTTGVDWALLVEQGKSEALAPARGVSLYVGGICLVIVVLVGAAGILFARYLANPIISLETTLRRVSSGDEAARAPVISSDETGQLAVSFNSMLAERNSVKDRIATENRRLQTNIQDFLLVVADASEGKLSIRAKKTEGILGNVADALNRMLSNVSVLIGEAKRASSAVGQAAAEISSSAQELADGAVAQTGQITQTIQDVQNLTAEAQNVSEISRNAADAASHTRKAAEDGARSLQEAITFMERLRENVQSNARKITKLGHRSTEISGIVRSISEISAETDVLAMNASIEAARAGEQGKGFTIVADQVRALADRTRQATVEIEKLVIGIQNETSEAVTQIETQNREVESGAQRVTSAGTSLSNIVETSVDSSTLAEQIRESAREQDKRAQAMLQAVMNINQISEEARNRTIEFRETSDQLALLAVELNKQLANFDIGSIQENTPDPDLNT